MVTVVGKCTAVLPRHVYGEVDLLLHQPYGVGNTVRMHTAISPFLPWHGYWEVDLLCRICVTRKFEYEEPYRARCPTANCYFDFVCLLFFLFLCLFVFFKDGFVCTIGSFSLLIELYFSPLNLAGTA